MIATGLSVPTQSGVGIAAATVSPMISGARLANNPSCKGCLISADGTRLYRPPTTKKNTPTHLNPTGTQANFVIRDPNTRTTLTNECSFQCKDKNPRNTLCPPL